jgi:hypothetical protein
MRCASRVSRPVSIHRPGLPGRLDPVRAQVRPQVTVCVGPAGYASIAVLQRLASALEKRLELA